MSAIFRWSQMVTVIETKRFANHHRGREGEPLGLPRFFWKPLTPSSTHSRLRRSGDHAGSRTVDWRQPSSRGARFRVRARGLPSSRKLSFDGSLD